MSKESHVICVSIKVLEVLHIQPEHNQLNGAVLHTEGEELYGSGGEDLGN